MFLVDTNVFLEILLRQDKKEDCKRFLEDHFGNISTTDFSLHSIGVILFRHDKEDIFQRFVSDIIPNVKLLSLPMEQYSECIKIKKSLKLEFDDAYQYATAKYYGMKLTTMDRDFEGIKDVEILFL